MVSQIENANVYVKSSFFAGDVPQTGFELDEIDLRNYEDKKRMRIQKIKLSGLKKRQYLE